MGDWVLRDESSHAQGSADASPNAFAWALNEAVEQWRSITEAQGADKQRGWLKKSEGF